ncbi:MAG: c-type cytochrome [Actinobacteria bacterium]|nr:c-type cytochrome [Actinomycetota bacterium]
MNGRRLTGWAVFLVAVVAVTAAARPRPAPAAEDQLATGRRLFLLGCSSCHGQDGNGVRTPDGQERGPSLLDSGEAGAYYELSTGRMPLANSDQQPLRKRPAYNESDQAALVAYVASLGDGPRLPEINRGDGAVASGGELFRANCAPCHSATGAGAALSYGGAAPPLHEATPLQVGAAVRAGPGQMPVFGPGVFTDDEVAGIARYVEYLRDPDDRGGLPIGRTGPVPEGAVAWFFGIGAFLAAVAWIGTRAPVRGARHD